MQLEYVKTQLKVNEQRLLADSAVIEHLRSNVKRLRVAGSWYRQCAFSKILSGSRPCDVSVQTLPVEFAKIQKAQSKSSVIDHQTAGPAGVGASKTAGDDSGSEDEKQENHYTYVDWSL